MMKKSKFTIVIKKEELRYKPRTGVQVGRVFKDKTKYNRKKKHRKEEDSEK